MIYSTLGLRKIQKNVDSGREKGMNSHHAAPRKPHFHAHDVLHALGIMGGAIVGFIKKNTVLVIAAVFGSYFLLYRKT